VETRGGDGALLVDKPAGLTSHDVVARVRKLFHTRAVGHTGTLDPFATGLLVLVLGAATRLARWAERRRKVYRATVRLGQTTTTDDLTGALVSERTPGEWPSLEAVGKALAALTGLQQQRPPAYSAKLIGGVRSYRLARRGGGGRGAAVEPAPVAVTVHRLVLVEYRPPLVTLRAEVSPGTYLRAVGRDLGEALGTGAHLTELRREQVGSWRVDEAHPLAGTDRAKF
jgi:tRNA pseudouridine55 synthase